MIQITPAAAQEIKRMQHSRQMPDSYLRLELVQGGCLDQIYKFSLVPDPQDGDRHLDSRSIKILIPPDQEPQLNQLSIDFSEDLMGGGFRFTNPLATKTCNCGQSFQP